MQQTGQGELTSERSIYLSVAESHNVDDIDFDFGPNHSLLKAHLTGEKISSRSPSISQPIILFGTAYALFKYNAQRLVLPRVERIDFKRTVFRKMHGLVMILVLGGFVSVNSIFTHYKLWDITKDYKLWNIRQYDQAGVDREQKEDDKDTVNWFSKLTGRLGSYFENKPIGKNNQIQQKENVDQASVDREKK